MILEKILKFFKLRSVYTIAFKCDQTIEYWDGTFTFSGLGVDYPNYTFLGKEAWRTPHFHELQKYFKLFEEAGLEPLVCRPTLEFSLNREDWSWGG